jgi:hypothetical protein
MMQVFLPQMIIEVSVFFSVTSDRGIGMGEPEAAIPFPRFWYVRRRVLLRLYG